VSAEVVHHLDALFAAALRLTRDRPSAEDLVQDTCVKAIRFAGRYEAGSNLRAWLFTILHNTHRNRLRGLGRDPVEVDSAALDQAAPAAPAALAPDAALLRDVLAPRVQAALDALPDVYRLAVWLRDVEDFSYREIADIVSVPVGTVMSRIARGRRLLYDRLADGGEPSGRRKESNR
jgi:RNA polymerase sigma-70 factor (ECF subfamily)